MMLLGFILGIVFCAIVFFACMGVLGDSPEVLITNIILGISIVAFVLYATFGTGGEVLITALSAIN